MSETLIAVDIGNSRIKLGRFDRATEDKALLPVPLDTLQLPLVDRAGNFDQPKLAAWADALPADGRWLVASVHRGAARKLIDAVGKRQPVVLLTQADVPIEVKLPAPERVGIDRLVAAAAANRLRQPGHSAIVVDHGSAITIDLVDAQGAFAGGAILPGIAMGAQALADHTDALPTVAIDTLSNATLPIGDSTVTAIEAGLYWGTFGAVRELVQRIADRQSGTPDVFVTGGAAAALAEGLAEHTRLVAQHVPHLVLAGVALVAEG